MLLCGCADDWSRTGLTVITHSHDGRQSQVSPIAGINITGTNNHRHHLQTSTVTGINDHRHHRSHDQQTQTSTITGINNHMHQIHRHHQSQALATTCINNHMHQQPKVSAINHHTHQPHHSTQPSLRSRSHASLTVTRQRCESSLTHQ